MTDKSNAYQWQWSAAAEKWVKVPHHCTSIRLTDAGLVYDGACDLHWVHGNPSVAESLFEITDDTDGSTAVVLDHFDTTRDGHMLEFCPALHFENGIWLKTFTNMTSVIFGFMPE